MKEEEAEEEKTCDIRKQATIKMIMFGHLQMDTNNARNMLQCCYVEWASTGENGKK